MKWYTTADAANLIGLNPRRIRRYARSGLLQPERGPRSEYRFSFQDLVLLRTAAGLHQARIPSRRIGRALDKLRRELPVGRSLSELRIVAEDDRIVVHDAGAAWNPLSGQYHLDFSVAELGQKVAPLAGRARREAEAAEPELSAEDWFELGLDLEAFAPDDARAAYSRALETDDSHVGSLINLGRLLHQAGELESARDHYRAALAAAPRHPTASFDLGVALEDIGRPDEAAIAYSQAIAWDPEFADAHYNLARLLEADGDKQGALRHLSACKRIIESRERQRGGRPGPQA